MPGPSVRWRTTGYRFTGDRRERLLRFYVDDLNQTINKAVADADLYTEIAATAGHPPGSIALVLSTYLADGAWRERVTSRMPGRRYLTVPAARLAEANIEMWPTAAFIDDVPDPLNDVHFDVVVAVGPDVVPTGMYARSKQERRAARAQLEPWFTAVLDLFDGPHDPAEPMPEVPR